MDILLHESGLLRKARYGSVLADSRRLHSWPIVDVSFRRGGIARDDRDRPAAQDGVVDLSAAFSIVSTG